MRTVLYIDRIEPASDATTLKAWIRALEGSERWKIQDAIDISLVKRGNDLASEEAQRTFCQEQFADSGRPKSETAALQRTLFATLEVLRSVPDQDQRAALVDNYWFTFKTVRDKPSDETYSVVCHPEAGLQIRFKHPDRKRLQEVTNTFIGHCIKSEKGATKTRVLVDYDKEIPLYEHGHEAAILYGSILGGFWRKLFRGITEKPIEFSLTLLFLVLAVVSFFLGHARWHHKDPDTAWWGGFYDRLGSSSLVAMVVAVVQVAGEIKAAFNGHKFVYWGTDHR